MSKVNTKFLVEYITSKVIKLIKESKQHYDLYQIFSDCVIPAIQTGNSWHLPLEDKSGRKTMEVSSFDYKAHNMLANPIVSFDVKKDYGPHFHLLCTIETEYVDDEDADFALNYCSISSVNGKLYIYEINKPIKEQELKLAILDKAKECIDVYMKNIKVNTSLNEGKVNETEKPLIENKRYYLGIPKALLRSRGEWSDSEVEYNGRLYNEQTIETSMYDEYNYISNSQNIDANDDDFYLWCKSSQGIDYFNSIIQNCNNNGDFEIVNTKLFQNCKQTYIVKDIEYNGIWFDGSLYDTNKVLKQLDKNDVNIAYDQDIKQAIKSIKPISSDLSPKNIGA